VADIEWSHLLPIGILMFGASLLGLTRRRAGRSLARREYPKLAQNLGLLFQAPAREGEVGTIHGELDGVRVRIESDERSRIVCFPRLDLGIDVRNYEHHKRTPEGYEVFSLKKPADDRWAKNRYVSSAKDVVPLRNSVSELLRAVGTDRDQLKGFTVDREKIECVFDFGKPAYLPAPVVSRVLPAMLALARLAGREQEREPLAS
jgi:hypothetical protein